MTTHITRGQELSPEDVAPANLGEIRPDDALDADLEALYEADDYEATEDAAPVDAGNSVDGEAWGWFRTIGESAAGSPWRLVPLSFPELSENVVAFSAWQSASMTGAVRSSGASILRDVAIVWNDDDENGRFIDVIYGGVDRDELVVGAVSSVLEGGGPLCPEHPDGWVLSLDVSERANEAVVVRAVGLIWRPCDQHLDAIVEVSGGTWRWVGEAWEPVVHG